MRNNASFVFFVCKRDEPLPKVWATLLQVGACAFDRSNPDHFNTFFSGDKESKKKQKSPASTGSASQVVVMRELKWDHQVSPFCNT